MSVDELKIFRGADYVINEKITIHQPTLGEIEEFGEASYFSTVYNITATPTDMKWQLHLIGDNWNEVTDYELFLKSYKGFRIESTSLLFGDLNFADFEIYKNNSNGELVLLNQATDTIIDKSIYEIIVSYLRKSHNIKKNVERAMTETTYTVLLEEAEENYNAALNKPFESVLLDLIDTMCCMEGFKFNQNNVWDMKINAFMKAVQRISHIKNADLLLGSGYSGFGVDLKKINKKQLNYFDGLSVS